MLTRERERESSSASQSIKVKNAKQGGFLGLELGLGIANVKIDKTTEQLETNESLPNKTYPHFPINFQFGYQWYFTQTMGLRLKGYVGYSNYFKELFKTSGTYNDTDYDDESTGDYLQDFAFTRDSKLVLNLDSHAIQYGVELAYIWDFLEKGKHTLGLDVAPIGLEASTYFPKFKYKYSGSTTYTWSGADTNSTGLPDTFTESKDESVSAESFETHTKLAYSASIGLHYYYNVNHQMFLSYKLRTYSTTPTAKKKNDDSTSATKISNVANHAILLGYAYKF